MDGVGVGLGEFGGFCGWTFVKFFIVFFDFVVVVLKDWYVLARQALGICRVSRERVL